MCSLVQATIIIGYKKWFYGYVGMSSYFNVGLVRDFKVSISAKEEKDWQ